MRPQYRPSAVGLRSDGEIKVRAFPAGEIKIENIESMEVKKILVAIFDG
jgi:hypothetical protein